MPSAAARQAISSLIQSAFDGSNWPHDLLVSTLLHIGVELTCPFSSSMRLYSELPTTLRHADRATLRRLVDDLTAAFEHASSSGRLGIEPARAPRLPSIDIESDALTQRHAPAEMAAEPRSWFEVKVLDVYGSPVEGAELLFVQSDRQQTVTTDASGIARWSDVEGGSFARVRLMKLDDLRALLRPRWGKRTRAAALDGPSVAMLSLLDDDLSAPLESATPKVLVLHNPITRVRLVGMHFDTNKCFLRESAMRGIRSVVSLYKAHPGGQLLIVGHTDTTGEDNYNLDLSVERAEMVKAYLQDDVAAWEVWFGESKPPKKRWGTHEISCMLDALPCEGTISSFQRWSNQARGTDLKVDGIAGPKTRNALIEAYMALDGTTVANTVEVVVHGCGEYFPQNDSSDLHGKDGTNAAGNRRVEIFCFADGIQPPVPSVKATRGEPEYEQWKRQVTHEIDLRAGVATVVVVDDITGAAMANVTIRVMHPDRSRTYVTNDAGEAFVPANADDALTILDIIHETHSSLTRIARGS